MCEELDKCYGTDGVPVRVTYTNREGKRRYIPEYKSFDHAKSRCNNPNTFMYENYGGRGIEFRFNSFGEWHEALGRKPTLAHSVDRIDGTGHYEKGNVRWATPKEQGLNRINVRTIKLTYPDGQVGVYESAKATAIHTRETEGVAFISRSTVLDLCHGKRPVSRKGYRASFAA